MNPKEDDLKIFNVEYISNHWTSIEEELSGLSGTMMHLRMV
jgi:hypothetical protein